MSSAIDVNRGVTIRSHPSGMRVYMYKSEPGFYYNVFGKVLPEKIAEQAGFPVASQRKERDRLDRQKLAVAAIDKEMDNFNPDKAKVLAERGDLKVVETAGDSANVIDGDGNVYNPHPISKTMALQMLDLLAPPDSKSEQKAEAEKAKETKSATAVAGAAPKGIRPLA